MKAVYSLVLYNFIPPGLVVAKTQELQRGREGPGIILEMFHLGQEALVNLLNIVFEKRFLYKLYPGKLFPEYKKLKYTYY